MGHDVRFLHVGAEAGGDLELMRMCWGDGFHYVPYSKPQTWASIGKRLRRSIKGTSLSIDDWYDPLSIECLPSCRRTFGLMS